MDLKQSATVAAAQVMNMFRASFSLFVTVSLLLSLSACGVATPNEKTEVGFRGAYSGTLSRNSETMVLGSIHHGGSLWSLGPPARQFDWNHQADQYSEILYSALSADGFVALTADYHNLAVWNAQTGESIWFWSAPARIRSVALSGDGRFALLGLGNNQAVLFDTVEGGVLREFPHEGPVLSVSLSDDASLALTGTESLDAHLWDVENNRLMQAFRLPNQVPLVRLSPDGRWALIAPARETAVVWDVTQGAVAHELKTGSYRLYSARYTDDGQLILGTTHRRILSFDLESGQRIAQWKVGRFWQNAFQSTTVLDMNWQNDRLLALGSDGFLYEF